MNRISPYHIIIAALLVIVLIQSQCKPKPVPCPETKITIDSVLIVDTLKIKGNTVYKPLPYKVIDTFVLRTEVDTSKIIAEYIKLRKYDLPVMNDSNGNVNVFASVQFNRISDWTYTAEFYPKTTIIEKNHVIIEKPRNSLYAGFGIGYQIESNKPVFKPVVTLITKKSMMYSVAYDPFNNAPEIGVSWKIGRK